jgi:hypothetical protein
MHVDERVFGAVKEDAKTLRARAERAEAERDEAVAKVAQVAVECSRLIAEDDTSQWGSHGESRAAYRILAALDTPATEGGEGA